jgi:dCTP deaminase
MASMTALTKLGIDPDSSGVFSDRLLLLAIENGIIDSDRFNRPPVENVQPASVDLRLGETAYHLRCSFLPGHDTVEQRLKQYGDYDNVVDLRDEGALLEIGRPYLIKLKERLSLPSGVQGKANPKSSTGRVDIFTRVITDYGHRFDEIADGYNGPLYLEVVPLSFPVRVREDLTLNQLRLFVGHPELTDSEILQAHNVDLPILFRAGQPVNDLSVSNGLFLGLDLVGDERGRVGFSAKQGAPVLDLTQTDWVDPDAYWDPVTSESRERVVLIPKRFYLLMSEEAVCIPPTMSAEMTAYDPTSGELRTHYAGFFDPGFGYDESAGFRGSRAALEVRAHDVQFMIENGQRVCKLTFQTMLEVPTRLYGSAIGSSYQHQEETLSKYFLQRRPPDIQAVSASHDANDDHLFPLDDS